MNFTLWRAVWACHDNKADYELTSHHRHGTNLLLYDRTYCAIYFAPKHNTLSFVFNEFFLILSLFVQNATQKKLFHIWPTLFAVSVIMQHKYQIILYIPYFPVTIACLIANLVSCINVPHSLTQLHCFSHSFRRASKSRIFKILLFPVKFSQWRVKYLAKRH